MSIVKMLFAAIMLAAWKFSGNPDLAQFHKGKAVIPCGYQGVLLQQ